MLLTRLVCYAWFLAGLLAFPLVAHGRQQQPTISGTVKDSVSGVALSGVRVELRRRDGYVNGRVESSARGRFRLSAPPGQYLLSVRAVGYRPDSIDLTLADRGEVLNVELTRLPLQLATVEVVSRTPEQLMSAPGAVALLGRESIEGRNNLVASDYLHDAGGIDIASKGLAQATFSARGPSAVNSAALLVLRDYRLASLPALRLNVPYFIPSAADDLERIEVARGPSSAVYGPDADRGVVHFISKSPFASRGASIDLTAGTRSVRQVEARVAGTLSERLGFKLSGQYLTGTDWEYQDPDEVLPRDPKVERAGGEARLDWRPDHRTTLVVSGGLTNAIRNVDLTTVGSVQVKDWKYGFGQVRLTRDRLAFNGFYNVSDAGESVLLYTGQPLVDQSSLWSGQLQHGLQLTTTLDLTYGADVQRVVPRTGGTYHGRYEADDDIIQAGGFVNGIFTLSPEWGLVAAARADHHSRLDDLALSPRVGLVFEPTSRHAFRLTWNRATSTPTATDLFLDLQVRPNLEGLPFEIRARGTNAPLTFRRDCTGGLCMRSPFVGDARAFLPLDATLAWSGLVAILDANGVDLSSIPRPGASDVGSVLGRLNPGTQSFDPVGVADVSDIPAAERRYNSTFETGYRGFLGAGLSISVDLFWSHLTNAASAREVQTPNLFLEEGSLAGYLGRFMSTQQAAAIAEAAARIPLGVVSPEQGDSTELLVVSREGSSASFWGADFGATAEIAPNVTVSGTYSYTSKDVIPATGGFGDIVFNAPRHKGSLGVRYSGASFTANLGGRAVSGFPVRSGEYVGRVESYLIFDGGVSYRLMQNPELALSLTAGNLFDKRHQEFVGAPALGRLILLRVRAGF